MRPSISGLLTAVLLALGSGCSFDLGLGDSTAGREGRLEFGYTGASAFDCFFGCGIDRPVASGSVVSVWVGGIEPTSAVSARTSSDVAAVLGWRAGHRCVAAGTIRSVAADQPCERHERREVTYVAALRADRAGAFDLEILTERGRLVDRVGLRAEDPIELELRDAAGGIHTQRIVVSAGKTEVFSPTLSGVSGPLAAHGDLEWTFTDASIAAAGSPLENLFGAPVDLVIAAKHPGVTSVVARVGQFERAFELVVEDARP
jgi:hypothetical protein